MTESEHTTIITQAFRAMNPSNGQHGWDHVQRVRENAVVIAGRLGAEGALDMRVLDACCVLHDLAYARHGENVRTYIWENRRVKRVLKDFFGNHPFSDRDVGIIVNACAHHARPFLWITFRRAKDMYTKILQDADTLDYFHRGRVERFFAARRQGMMAIAIRLFGRQYVAFVQKHAGRLFNFPESALLLR